MVAGLLGCSTTAGMQNELMANQIAMLAGDVERIPGDGLAKQRVMTALNAARAAAIDGRVMMVEYAELKQEVDHALKDRKISDQEAEAIEERVHKLEN